MEKLRRKLSRVSAEKSAGMKHDERQGARYRNQAIAKAIIAARRKKLKESMTASEWRMFRKKEKEQARQKYLLRKVRAAERVQCQAKQEAARLADEEYQKTPEAQQLQIDRRIGESSYLTRSESFAAIPSPSPFGWTQERWDEHVALHTPFTIEAQHPRSRSR